MTTSDPGNSDMPMSGLATTFLAMRDTVLAQWTARVTAEIPSASRLGAPILVDTLPSLYENIAQALAVGAPRPFATTDTNLATAHGRERANMTDYGPHELIHELQIFREVLFGIAAARRMPLSKRDAEVIGHSIEEAAHESGKMKLKLHVVRFDIMTLIEEVCPDLPLFGQQVKVEGERIEGYWCRTSLKRIMATSRSRNMN